MIPKDLTCEDLAAAMKITVCELFWIARHTDQVFWPTREQTAKNGKVREIDAPKKNSKKLYRKLHRFWARHFRPHPIAHGGVKGKSAFTSARCHLGKAATVTRDISNCFPSIKDEAMRRCLLARGFRSDTAWVMSRLFTVHGRVAQGSPLSNDAVNEFLRKLDDALASVCGRSGMSPSRLTDDIVVSVNDTELVPVAGELIESQIIRAGLVVNAKKRDKNGVQLQSAPTKVHNLNVASSKGIRINRKHWQKAIDVATEYVRLAKTVTPASLEHVARKRQEATGWMYNCRQADLTPAHHINKLIKAGDRHVNRALKAVKIRTSRWWVQSKKKNPATVAKQWERRQLRRARGRLVSLSIDLRDAFH